MAAPGWYPDPTGRFELRWFDGAGWSASVSRGGQQSFDDPSAAPTAPASSGMNVGVLVGAILLVAALVVGGAVYLTRSSDSTAVTSATTTPSSVASGVGSQPVDFFGESLPYYDRNGIDPAVGTRAPVLHGVGLDGHPITIDASDGPYMVVFLAHWCPHCNREIPRLVSWAGSGGVPKKLKIVGVATAVGEALPNYPPGPWLAAKEWPWPAMIDQPNGEGVSGIAADAFCASGWPYFVIVGTDGKVKARVS
ncbi:MAG: DUF2510 domain-containing protein, partial [Actinomycetota bacterium]